MIVVIGSLHLRTADPEPVPDGLAAGIAIAAVGAGASVEVVSRVGDDAAGDALLLELAQRGVGHVAVLRDAAFATVVLEAPDEVDATAEDVSEAPPVGPMPTQDAGDVGLALRYLTDFRVIVVAHPVVPGILDEVAAAAAWASAHLIVIAAPGSARSVEVPAGTLVVEAPDDAAGVATALGRYAAAVDAGQDPAASYATIVADATPIQT